MSPSWTITAVCLLMLTVYCSYIGDDDVVYDYLYRRPTPNEGLRRIRWVLLRTFASMYGGFVLAGTILKFLIQFCSIRVVGQDTKVLLAFACIALANILIGILSNGMRRLRGRPTRPLIDPIVWRRSRGPLKPER